MGIWICSIYYYYIQYCTFMSLHEYYNITCYLINLISSSNFLIILTTFPHWPNYLFLTDLLIWTFKYLYHSMWVDQTKPQGTISVIQVQCITVYPFDRWYNSNNYYNYYQGFIQDFFIGGGGEAQASASSAITNAFVCCWNMFVFH